LFILFPQEHIDIAQNAPHIFLNVSVAKIAVIDDFIEYIDDDEKAVLLFAIFLMFVE